ncbi:DUF1345 domain-containing protein [Mucilaginibacter gynuensis]|uniref:DUF1345 domain-containing protein n=1 Tax=Mucilaginibacter gynuensis TaxID=1302236 RepID=A0ABP8HKG3_9SPHI
MPAVKPQLPKSFFFRLDAHFRVYVSLAVAIGAFFCFRHLTVLAVALVTWIAFAFTVIVLDWIIIIWAHPREIRRIASLEDSSRTAIFLFVIGASLISLLAIYLLLKSSKGHADDEITTNIFLSMTAVLVSWWLVHTLFSMRYAHLYYQEITDDGKKTVVGGLDFPGKEDPDYLDFVYFGFVVGMTFQVSDVEITSRTIRRLTLMHGLISFAFNTAIVALSINVISGLVSG